MPQNLAAACGRFDRPLGAIIETAAAGLMLCEIMILLAGVTSCYVFDDPLIWSNEILNCDQHQETAS